MGNKFNAQSELLKTINIEAFILAFGGHNRLAQVILAAQALDEALDKAGIPHNCSLDHIITKAGTEQ